MPEREARFAAGFDDGVGDQRRSTGRAIGNEDIDYAFGYVAGKYGQVACTPVRDYESAKQAWKALSEGKR